MADRRGFLKALAAVPFAPLAGRLAPEVVVPTRVDRFGPVAARAWSVPGESYIPFPAGHVKRRLAEKCEIPESILFPDGTDRSTDWRVF